jgi:hypothetical protein
VTTRLDRGRIRHEHHSVPVPREVRLAIFSTAPTGPKVAKAFGVSEATAYALLEPGGFVRADVLERVKAALEQRERSGQLCRQRFPRTMTLFDGAVA